MIVQAASLLLLGIVLGTMLFFAAVVTPSLFRLLPIEAARPLLRGLFPDYYLWCGAVSAVAAMLLFLPPTQVLPAILVGLVSAGFFLARRELIPRMDMMREQADEDGFKRLHAASMVLNTAQMAVLFAVFIQQLVLR